jgi:type I restriction enzyme S subunit
MKIKMKDSGICWIGLIPNHWKVIKHKYVMYKKKQICSKYNGEKILSLTKKGVIVRDLDNPTGKMPATFDGYQIVEKGNLLLCMFDIDVTPRCVGLIKCNGLTSPAYSQFVLKENNDARYYNYLLEMIDDKKHFLHLSKNLRNSLTETDFGHIMTIVPPTEEQISIANILDEKIDRINYTINKTLESIKEYKIYMQSLITEKITKGLHVNVPMKDSGIGWIGTIPKHWNIKRLRYLGTLQNGISKSADFFGSGYPFVSYGDVYSNHVLPQKVTGLIQSSISDRNNYSVEKGDVFFTRTSETIEEIGLTSTCKKSIMDAVFAGFVIRFRPKSNELVPDFSKYYFRCEIHRRFFVKEMNLVTRASLSQELLKKLPVLLPPISEQLEIANYLDEKCSKIDEIIISKENLLKELESLKKSLIYEYVTGKRGCNTWIIKKKDLNKI